MTRKISLIWLALILIVAAGLRLYQLSSRSIWFDEAFSVEMVTGFSWWEMVRRTALDVHPPFYYVLLRLWVAICGTSLLAVRGLSVIFGLATIVAVYVFCRDAVKGEGTAAHDVGRRAGVFAAALVSICSAQISWSQEARMYSLGSLLAVLSSWCLLRAVRAKRCQVRWLVGYAFSAAAFLYTHNYALFTVFGQGCFIVVWYAWQHRKRLSSLRLDSQFRRVAIAFVAACWMYVPWFPVLMEQKRRVQSDYWIQSISSWSVPNAWYRLIAPENNGFPPEHWVSLLVAGLSLAILAMHIRSRVCVFNWLTILLALTPVVCAATISMTSVSLIVARHFLYSQIFLLVALAWLLAEIPDSIARTVLLTVVLFDGAYLHGIYLNQTDATEHLGMRGAVAYVEAHWHTGDRFVVVHPCMFHAAKYHSGEEFTPLLYLPTGELKHYTGGPIRKLGDSVGAEELAGSSANRLWILDSSGLTPGYSRPLLPEVWRGEDQVLERFTEVKYFQGDVIVTCRTRSDND